MYTKKKIRQDIGDFFMACGYEDRDGEACKTRLHTLVTAFRQYEILSDKPSTKPKYVVSSTKIMWHLMKTSFRRPGMAAKIFLMMKIFNQTLLLAVVHVKLK